MSEILKRAFGEAEELPDEAQDALGAALLESLEKWRALRADIQTGLNQLDRGGGRAAEDVLRRIREGDG